MVPSILQAMTIVQPETVVRWHRAGFRRYWRWKSRGRGGRPPIQSELRALIRRMSVENVLWGAPRIQGELLKLGFVVAQSTVARYMARKGDPSGQTWGPFLRNHAPHIAAMDLFVVPTIGFIQLYVLVIVRLARRELVWINVTRHPTTEWIAQQITEAFPWNEAPRNLVRDQDGIYGAAVRRRLPAMGIRDKPIAPGSPWQNGYAERLIGTIRRECVDHLIVFGEAHLHPSRVCRLLQWVTDPSRFEPRCSPPSAGSEHRRHHITTCSRRTSSPILPDLSFRHTQVHMREPLWGGADVWRFGHPL
jgi:transposase InsO family protein